MTQHAMNRREFVAVGTATAASVALASTTFASTTSPSPARSLRIPAPSLARVIRDPSNPSTARLQHGSLRVLMNTASRGHPLTDPSITISPLGCISDRLTPGASITIQALHPIPNLYSHLLHAHNTPMSAGCLPDFASTVQTRAPQDAFGRTTLRIIQRVQGVSQSKTVTIDTASAGTYLLAIPTAPSASSPAWRLSGARLDESGEITTLTNPLAAASARCVYLSITIHQNTSEHPTTGASSWD